MSSFKLFDFFWDSYSTSRIMIIVNLAIKNENYTLSNFNKLSIQAKLKIERMTTTNSI